MAKVKAKVSLNWEGYDSYDELPGTVEITVGYPRTLELRFRYDGMDHVYHGAEDGEGHFPVERVSSDGREALGNLHGYRQSKLMVGKLTVVCSEGVYDTHIDIKATRSFL